MAEDEATLRSEALMIAKRIQRHEVDRRCGADAGVEEDAFALAERVVKLESIRSTKG